MFSSRSLTHYFAAALPLCLLACAADNASRSVEMSQTADRQPVEREQEPAPTAPRVSHREFLVAIQALAPESSSFDTGRSAPAPVNDPSLLFTDEQRALMADAIEAVQEELSDYMREHRAEMRELLPLTTPRIENETPEDRQRRDHARERLAEIRANAPSPDAHHDRLWRAMTEPQRMHVLTQIAESRPTLPSRAEMRRGESTGRTPPTQPPTPPTQAPQAEAEPAESDDQVISFEERVFDGGAPLDHEERMQRIRRRTAIAQERLARMQAEEAEAARKAAEDSSPKKDEESPDDEQAGDE
ncbi:MAG: hypothetical protein EA376_05335 [Phycisphaeraceae bacterium]|nr:MAG: hypothetical protein EA376_05335 [Phycisphaeraceae bacterium]